MQRPGRWTASNIIGDGLRNAAGENVGKIEDLYIDPASGRVSYAVLSLGGFSGMGDKLVAVPWDALNLATSSDYLILPVENDALRRAAWFDRNHWPDMSDPEWQASTRAHFGGRSPVTSRDNLPVIERPVLVAKDRRPPKSMSLTATVLLFLLLIGIGWVAYRVSTGGWEQAKDEMLNTVQGAAYAMKETSEDATLTARVQAAYALSRRIPSNAKINVDSKDGVVTLRGEVALSDARTHAEELARDVPGVQEVRNHLYVTGGTGN